MGALSFNHFTFQLDLDLICRIDWQDGQAVRVSHHAEDEEAKCKFAVLFRWQEEYQSKVKEMLEQPLPYDIVTDEEQASILQSKFEMEKVLGAGAFGTVNLARNKVTGELRAIKTIPKKLQEKELLEAEIKLMRAAKAAMGEEQYVVELFETYEGPGEYYLVMEVVSGGEVYDRIKKKGKFTEAHAHSVVRQLLTGMSKLHIAGIMHRDLKPENLLYASQDDDALVKIADFGLGCFYKDAFDVYDACGTPMYMAPELILSGESVFFDRNGMPCRLYRTYGPNADVWSCGCIMYQLLCGRCPFEPKWIDGVDGSEGGWDLDGLYRSIIEGQYRFREEDWHMVSRSAKSLVATMLQVNPSNRPTSSAALEHPWITSEPQHVVISHVPTNIAKFQSRFSSASFDPVASQATRQKFKESATARKYVC